MEFDSITPADAGAIVLYRLSLLDFADCEDTRPCIAYCAMKRPGGLLLCVPSAAFLPSAAFPLELLEAAEGWDYPGVLGPHTTVNVQAVGLTDSGDWVRSFPVRNVDARSTSLPTTALVQQHWDQYLAHLFGTCTLQCTATLERDHALFVQISPRSQPWIVRLPTGIDVFSARQASSDFAQVELGSGWSLAPTSRQPHFGLASVVESTPGQLCRTRALPLSKVPRAWNSSARTTHPSTLWQWMSCQWHRPG